LVTRSKSDVIYYPRIYFEVFHPDLTYVQNHGAYTKSPMDDYHSKIIFFAYLRGLSVNDTLRLFNAEFYEALGYLNLWAPAKEILFQELRATNFPTDELLSKWSRLGCFMHSTNHPKLPVLSEIARILLERLDVEGRC